MYIFVIIVTGLYLHQLKTLNATLTRVNQLVKQTTLKYIIILGSNEKELHRSSFEWITISSFRFLNFSNCTQSPVSVSPQFCLFQLLLHIFISRFGSFLGAVWIFDEKGIFWLELIFTFFIFTQCCQYYIIVDQCCKHWFGWCFQNWLVTLFIDRFPIDFIIFISL